MGLEEHGSPFLSCPKPNYSRHNFQESHSPLSTRPRVFISHPERRFRCRLFVLTIFQIPSPINARDSEHVRSPPCTSPQVQTHLRRPPPPQFHIQGPSPARPRPHALPSTLRYRARRPPRLVQRVPPLRPRRPPPPSLVCSPPTAATALTMKSRRTPESTNPD